MKMKYKIIINESDSTMSFSDSEFISRVYKQSTNLDDLQSHVEKMMTTTEQIETTIDRVSVNLTNIAQNIDELIQSLEHLEKISKNGDS